MSPDSPADRYHRRRRAPILIVIAVLLIAGGVAWFQVLKPEPAASTSCNQPGPAPATTTATTKKSTSSSKAPTTSAKTTPKSTVKTTATTATTTSIVTSLGRFASPDSLTGVRPADPATVTVQVLNASKVVGQARTVAGDLRTAGFTSILGAANDPLYPASDLACTAEIRYGQAGTAAARTLLLAEPCAQLVLDDRISDSVDLALGNNYTYGPIDPNALKVLAAIHEANLAPAVIEGVTSSARPTATIPPYSSAGCN